MGRHAYCIIAHSNWAQLQTLLSVLDDKRNDIFIHIDKSSMDSFRRFGGVSVLRSRLFFVDPIHVVWGQRSLMDCELRLFREVLKEGESYSTIHLLSGSDLPLKSQDEIHAFFNARPDEEFVSFSEDKYKARFEKRIKYYHIVGIDRNHKSLKTLIRRVGLVLQMPFVNRLRHSPLTYEYGSEWCSLTLRAVKELLDKSEAYSYMFDYTAMPDEHYKHMILKSFGEFSFAHEGNLRYIDWSEEKASPKVLTMGDYDTLMSSGCLFARKFDERVDQAVIDQIVGAIRR